MLNKLLLKASEKLTEEEQVKLAALLLNNVLNFHAWNAELFWKMLEEEPKQQLLRQLP